MAEMLKVGLDAGHGLPTPARRVWKQFDPNQTQEWQLNDSICRYVEDGLNDYEDVEVIRLDDRTGKMDVPLPQRSNKANRENVDIVISNHADAGINGGDGGGITTFTQPGASAKSKDYQKKLYKKLIEHTGLKGNRATPIATKNLHMTRETKMPAVLIENGFMDSATDGPIIVTDKFARQSAAAQVEFIVEEFKLVKKSIKEDWVENSTGWWYRNSDGSYPKNQWQKINSKWYYFDSKGYMVTGWLQLGDKWYYLDSSGAMQTGWRKSGSRWFYLKPNGEMATGWINIKDKWYFLHDDGSMAENVTIEFSFNEKGEWVK